MDAGVVSGSALVVGAVAVLRAVTGAAALSAGGGDVGRENHEYRDVPPSVPLTTRACYSGTTAIAEIDTFALRGMAATWIVARAGGAFLKNVA